MSLPHRYRGQHRQNAFQPQPICILGSGQREPGAATARCSASGGHAMVQQNGDTAVAQHREIGGDGLVAQRRDHQHRSSVVTPEVLSARQFARRRLQVGMGPFRDAVGQGPGRELADRSAGPAAVSGRPRGTMRPPAAGRMGRGDPSPAQLPTATIRVPGRWPRDTDRCWRG